MEWKKKKDIIEENLKLKARLTKRNSSYWSSSLLEKYLKIQEIKHNISNIKSKPCFNYPTLSQFKKNIPLTTDNKR